MPDEESESIVLTEGLIEREGLKEWAEAFALGTAGYRDRLDPADMDNPFVYFNRTKIAIVAEAKARVYDRLFKDKEGPIERHVGGEVRPHTNEFIELAARIYAAHGHRVHLRQGADTTPIWYSSFGVFYNELDDGENFTASHSPNYKGGWKPMNAFGKQLLKEADLIAEEVRGLITPGYEIRLAPKDSEMIVKDFDVTRAYCEYITSIVLEDELKRIQRAYKQGFLVFVSTMGGSMAKTVAPIFESLKIESGIRFLHGEEDPNYHGLGIVDGINYGVDPGKQQVYRNLGAQKILSESTPGAVFFVWDPDGDRFNMITTAPATIKAKTASYGLETQDLDSDRIAVYFKPNQIYFMLTLHRIEQIRAAGDLESYDWIVAETFPTSRSIGQVAKKHGLEVVRTPVGFKYFGDISEQIEQQLSNGPSEVTVKTPTGDVITLGGSPRILLMAEESGGAVMGGTSLAVSKNGNRKSLVLKEKDGMQIGLAAMALAARLYTEGRSFAEFYMDGIETNNITYRHYERLDVTLYDENLPPEELSQEKEKGLRKRDRVVQFFKDLAGRSPAEVKAELEGKGFDAALPHLERVIWAGDGTLMEFEDMWWEVRASGTDALLRYYIEGKDRDTILSINRAFSRMDL